MKYSRKLSERNDMLLIGENNLTHSILFLINGRGQKEVAQHLSAIERKELPTQNSLSHDSILQEGKGNKDIL